MFYQKTKRFAENSTADEIQQVTVADYKLFLSDNYARDPNTLKTYHESRNTSSLPR